MNNTNKNHIVITSLIWKLIENSGTQGVQFIVQLVLARKLMPNDYGIVSLLAIFISIANVFVQSGFNTALIQKKNVDKTDFSSVFYLSLFVATLLYSILFLTAPNIADFYRIPEITSVLRILAVTLFFGAFNSIQYAVVARNMQFKKLLNSSLGAMVVSGVVGIILAYLDYGVWALVAQQLVNKFTITIILWFTIEWRPILFFSFSRIKGLFEYGSKLLISSLIDTVYSSLRSLIIGKIYNPEMLGFYERGNQFPSLVVTNINGSIQSVMLPALSLEQDNKKRVKEMVRRSIVTSSFVVFPMMVGLAVVAEPLVKLILTEKWLPCVPFLQIACVCFALYPIHTANLQAINALGRSDIFLKLEIIKKAFGILILIATMNRGIFSIALGMLISDIISVFINTYPNKQLISYSYKEQWIDIMPSALISIVMGGIVYLFNFLNLSNWQIFVLQVVSGSVIYIGLAKIFKIESFNYLAETMKKLVKSKKYYKN